MNVAVLPPAQGTVTERGGRRGKISSHTLSLSQRERERESDRQTGKQADRRADRQAETYRDKETGKERERRETDRSNQQRDFTAFSQTQIINFDVKQPEKNKYINK